MGRVWEGVALDQAIGQLPVCRGPTRLSGGAAERPGCHDPADKKLSGSEPRRPSQWWLQVRRPFLGALCTHTGARVERTGG